MLGAQKGHSSYSDTSVQGVKKAICIHMPVYWRYLYIQSLLTLIVQLSKTLLKHISFRQSVSERLIGVASCDHSCVRVMLALDSRA